MTPSLTQVRIRREEAVRAEERDGHQAKTRRLRA